MVHKKFINIGIIPSIKETYKNQFEFSLDIRIFNLLDKIFKNYKSFIVNENDTLSDIDIVIILGGNDIKKFNNKKNNIIRNRTDLKILKLCLKKNIKILGICYGAQIIAKYFKSEMTKVKNHVGSHEIIFFKKEKNYTKKVNSFHNIAISKLKKPLIKLAIAKDFTCEAFTHKNKKILGIMWHPERNIIIQKHDIKFINKYLCS